MNHNAIDLSDITKCFKDLGISSTDSKPSPEDIWCRLVLFFFCKISFNIIFDIIGDPSPNDSAFLLNRKLRFRSRSPTIFSRFAYLAHKVLPKAFNCLSFTIRTLQGDIIRIFSFCCSKPSASDLGW